MCKKTTRRLLAAMLAVLTALSIVSCSSDEPEAIVEPEAPEIVEEAPAEPEIVVEEEPVTPEEIVEPEPPVEPEEVVEPAQPEEPAAPVVVAPVIVEPEQPPAQEEPAEPAPEIHDYALNTNTMKFHKMTCSSVAKIKEKNRGDFTGTRDEVMARGFDPCGNCHP